MFYDYICQNCGITEEVQHGMSEEPIIKCSKCDTQMNKKITGGSGVHYKGAGWAGKRNVSGNHSEATKMTMKKKYTPIDEY